MKISQDIEFIDNPKIADRMDKYQSVSVNAQKVIESWRQSLRAFEWLHPDGRIKDTADLKPEDQERRKDIEECLRAGKPIEKPVLGIGLIENIEIGIGRATFLIIAANGLTDIPVHIPRTHQGDFDAFLSS